MEAFQTAAKQCDANISKMFPCRSEIINQLYVGLNLGQCTATALPGSIFIYGDRGTGKTSIIRQLLRHLPQHRSTIIDCVECYTSKIIYETVVNELFDHQLTAENNYSSYARCENARDFVSAIGRLPANSSSSSTAYIIVFDDAHRLRDLEANVLNVFLRLRETTQLNITCLFVATLPFEKLYPTGSFPMPICVHWPNYTQKETYRILISKFPQYKAALLQAHFVDEQATDDDQRRRRRRTEIIDSLKIDFFENYLNLFLNTFFRTCRDLNELRLVSRDCFERYCAPVLEGQTDVNDVRALYKNVAAVLKTAVSTIYRKIDRNLDNAGKCDDAYNVTTTAASTTTHLAQQLPYYAKYLLIAAYLASHNDVKLDKRLFMKHHGKKKKTQRTINANQMVSEKMSTQMGPKSFSIDRLLAIFYSIVEEKVPLTCNLMAQIPSLVHLKLLNFVSGESNIMEGAARLQCIVSLEFILQIGRNVGFNVRQYLGDFI